MTLVLILPYFTLFDFFFYDDVMQVLSIAPPFFLFLFLFLFLPSSRVF